MKYLHHGHPTLMVHCDLKPNNVQIDDNMVIHLGDFGIAKLLSENVSRKQTTTLVTIGYITPSDFPYMMLCILFGFSCSLKY